MPPVPRNTPILPGIEKATSITARDEPLWKGPDKDGVTSSLLSRYLCCKERFRLQVIDGWGPKDHWNNRLEFGNLWHKAEEALASESAHFGEVVGTTLWRDNINGYAEKLLARYPMQRDEVYHYYNICKATFPEYMMHWEQHPDVKGRTPLLQEQVFDVRYVLPSGRSVLLRGKWDSVDLITENGVTGVYLQENKTKSTIDSRKIGRQLTFDLQTQLYLIALTEEKKRQPYGSIDWFPQSDIPILGVRYNVIRRSMHKLTPKDGGYDAGGNGGFNARLVGLIRESPQEWFARWKVDVTEQDIKRFKRQCLDPVLENLYDDYEWWLHCHESNNLHQAVDIVRDSMVWEGETRRKYWPKHCPRQFRMPYGIYNPVLEGQEGDLDGLLDTGSTLGLRRIDNLFPELTGE